MSDLEKLGAVSDERAAEQISAVERVYAGKSETPTPDNVDYHDMLAARLENTPTDAWNLSGIEALALLDCLRFYINKKFGPISKVWWLIERDSPAEYACCTEGKNPREDWTIDSDLASKFNSKEDAEKYIDYYGMERGRAVDHMFINR